MVLFSQVCGSTFRLHSIVDFGAGMFALFTIDMTHSMSKYFGICSELTYIFYTTCTGTSAIHWSTQAARVASIDCAFAQPSQVCSHCEGSANDPEAASSAC